MGRWIIFNRWGWAVRAGGRYFCVRQGKLAPALIQAVFHVGDCFWVRENRRLKNQKNIFFQDKFYSLKALAHYFAVFIYLPTWKSAKLIFLLILCSQTYPDVAKAWTHYYMYTLYRSPAAFYECLITVVITLFRTTACSCTTTFSYYRRNFCFKPLTILVKCCIIDIWQGFECTCTWLISEFV